MTSAIAVTRRTSGGSGAGGSGGDDADTRRRINEALRAYTPVEINHLIQEHLQYVGTTSLHTIGCLRTTSRKSRGLGRTFSGGILECTSRYL